MAANETVYCLCRQHYDETRFMIQCDVCKDWYHGSCVGIQEFQASDIEIYHCPHCQVRHGPLVVKKRKNWHRYDYSENGDNGKVQTGTVVFIRELKSRTFPSADEIPLLRVPGHQLTVEYMKKTQFERPILIEKKDGLGMIVPPTSFSIQDVENHVGSMREIDVIDVSRQEDYKMLMREWTEYYNSPNRNKIFNVISLEFSNTRLSELVEVPAVVRKISWVHNYWPDQLPEDCHYTKPMVQKYCLMGVKDSFTDFHVDFGGTSVWYHVLRGEKVFYLIRPTSANLSLYERWVSSSNQSETFFGDQVDMCYKCTVKQGQTLFIPTGWIHAVLTPIDSLVFGGNFLHNFNISLQLEIYEMERVVKTPDKYMFPQFEMITWYAATAINDILKEHSEENTKPPQYLLSGAKAMLPHLKGWMQRKDFVKSQKQATLDPMSYGKIVKDLQKEVRHHEKPGSRAKSENRRRKKDPDSEENESEPQGTPTKRQKTLKQESPDFTLKRGLPAPSDDDGDDVEWGPTSKKPANKSKSRKKKGSKLQKVIKTESPKTVIKTEPAAKKSRKKKAPVVPKVEETSENYFNFEPDKIDYDSDDTVDWNSSPEKITKKTKSKSRKKKSAQDSKKAPLMVRIPKAGAYMDTIKDENDQPSPGSIKLKVSNGKIVSNEKRISNNSSSSLDKSFSSPGSARLDTYEFHSDSESDNNPLIVDDGPRRKGAVAAATVSSRSSSQEKISSTIKPGSLKMKLSVPPKSLNESTSTLSQDSSITSTQSESESQSDYYFTSPQKPATLTSAVEIPSGTNGSIADILQAASGGYDSPDDFHIDVDDSIGNSTEREAIGGLLSMRMGGFTPFPGTASRTFSIPGSQSRAGDLQTRRSSVSKTQRERARKIQLSDDTGENMPTHYKDDEFVYPHLELDADESEHVFKPRGRPKKDETWNPKAKVTSGVGEKVDRPVREGVKKEAVESGLAAAAAALADKPPPKRQYIRKKPKPEKPAEPEPGPSNFHPLGAAGLTIAMPGDKSASASGRPAPISPNKTATKKPRKGMATAKQRLGKILKIHRMVY
ncbi:histone lysine demethylase PHF8-like [Tubulanus polymorphus]|uniref:histone lysine demethylase PHF8-like n=1 Tax=Tubulanus polymorphus TaxID=672921 RepID=UPI003DA2FC45